MSNYEVYMSKNVVLMPVIPKGIRGGAKVYSDLRYAAYGIASWKWWCRQHDVEFVILDQPLLTEDHFSELPPTVQRWAAPSQIIEKYGSGTRVAVVDADTMIRWDAPNLFEMSGPGFSAIRDLHSHWIYQSIKAHKSFFPGIHLPWWEYFNAGVVILEQQQLHITEALVNLFCQQWPALSGIQKAGDVGTDQTILNFLVRKANEPVNVLPQIFNFVHCFPMDFELMRLDRGQNPDLANFAMKAFSRKHAFDFIDMAYVWHFTSVRASRHLVMDETWRRICSNYPGADITALPA
jgi:hypothetical protein